MVLVEFQYEPLSLVVTKSVLKKNKSSLIHEKNRGKVKASLNGANVRNEM